MKINTYFLPFKLQAVRKNLLLTLAVFGLVFSWQTQAQTGDTCDDPIEISALPFNDSGNTSDYGSNYTGGDIPPVGPNTGHFDGTGAIYYLDGDEAVYAFTSNGNGTIDIETVNDEGWNSLYVFTGCPFSLTLGYNTSTTGTDREIIGLPVSTGETYYIVVSNWNDGGQDYTIDITGDITIPEECEGTPSAGTPDDLEMSVCEGNEFDLSVLGASEIALGQDRIWQSSASGDNNWVDIDGATAPSYTVDSGIAESTDYRYKITCNNTNETDTSDVITVTLKLPNQCYCDDATSTNVEPITSVIFAGIDNSSPASTSSDGYEDFTDIVAEVEVNETYVFSAEGNTNGNYEAYFTVWIDWNQNGLFETAEMYEIDGFIENSDGTDGQQVTGDIVVPSSAVLGETVMRIRKRYSMHQTDPCGSYTFGQTEDYAVNVSAGDPITCQEPSDLTVADITETTVNVSWTEGGSETEWDVVYGAPGFDPEVDGTMMTTTDNPTALTDLDAGTEYEVYVRAICEADDQSDFNGPVAFMTLEMLCDMPSDLVVAEVTDTTADVSWTQVGNETEWEIVYGAPGFDPETEGTTITTQDNPTTLMNLDPETDYEVYVIAICADGNSEPLGPEAFTTEILSVNTQVFENLSFYPNPVKNQLTLKAGKQIENVEIYNLLGQNVLRNMPNSLEAQLNTDHLQAGVYLMKVTIHKSTKTFKIVKN
ncbi:GEVED domain-containing protein [Mesonia sp. MT50]|uniref:GEVED domain-containing protein n=1 Tax=Mesonia profundi TaxID=3070998 RepID=A0ABU1A3V0_9FLAO|nr:GEVED domain-containing protein [Mesonia profundi]MDQ7918361.1 GEVED domain-containing protein [Mesonia profundi]